MTQCFRILHRATRWSLTKRWMRSEGLGQRLVRWSHLHVTAAGKGNSSFFSQLILQRHLERRTARFPFAYSRRATLDSKQKFTENFDSLDETLTIHVWKGRPSPYSYCRFACRSNSCQGRHRNYRRFKNKADMSRSSGRSRLWHNR